MPADPATYTLPDPTSALLAELEDNYRDLHANPELSMQERRTSKLASGWLRKHGYEVTEGIGGTGVVGLLRNGDGPTVLLRADMDALPIKESTGLPYASDKAGTDRFGQATSIAHACGHDMHIAWLMGATRILAENRSALARHGDGRVPAGRGDRPGRPGDDRGRHGQTFPQAGRDSRSARHAAVGRTDRLAHRHHAVGRRQLGGDAVRPRGTWLDAAEKRRSSGDGSLGGNASANGGRARGGDDRFRRGHGRHHAGGHEREYHPGPRPAAPERPHLQGRGAVPRVGRDPAHPGSGGRGLRRAEAAESSRC